MDWSNKRDFSLKRREDHLPPEKLREILGRMYPEEMADKLYDELTLKADDENDGSR